MAELPALFIQALTQRLGESYMLTTPEACWPYGSDDSKRFYMPPAVALPKTHDDVVFITQLCNAHQVPLIPRGLGSGTVGGAVPIKPSLVLSLARMNQILNIDADNRVMLAEPGVTNFAIQEAAKAHGFCWAPDPGSREYCTLGGNLAHNSAGPRAVKYGTPRENTLGLQAVTGAGNTLKTGVYTSKGVVGYDLTRLLIGSEGTLATITQATLKLIPMPSQHLTIRALYKDIHSAAAAVSKIMAQHMTPSALEFMDRTAVHLVREQGGVHLPKHSHALLLIGVDGSDKAIADGILAITSAAKNRGLITMDTARSKTEIHQLWQARRRLSPCLRSVAPKKINEDIVVPVSHIPKLINELDVLSRQYGITIVTFGHAGNGNLHVNLMYDPADAKQAQNIQPCLQAMFDLVLSLKGTLSGEHGVGLAKQPFISQELEAHSIALMRDIKQVFDPLGILNPGKIFPSTD